MNFKKFIENSKDIEETLNCLPKSHVNLLSNFNFKYTCDNTLDTSNSHIGILKDKNITVSAPWYYSRQFTTLHEIAHVVWCKVLSNKQKEFWKKIFLKEKNKIKHASINQSAEEIFCMCYANYFSRHKLLTYENEKWNKFIKDLE